MMKYKSLLCCVAGYLLFSAIGAQTSGQETTKSVNGVPKVVDTENRSVDASDRIPNAITIFLCGDVMTGRGIDQILPHPSDPAIYESYMKSAQGYVKVDIIHGHSSHHVKAIEVYKEKLILYGCGDFLSDILHFQYLDDIIVP